MVRIEEGPQTLTGDEALAYVRARANSSDHVRMARQRCLLTAMLDGVDPVTLLGGLTGLMETIETHLTTDLPLEFVPDLIRMAGTVSPPDVAVVGFGPDWSTGRNDDGYHVPDVERIREAVDRTSPTPALPPISGLRPPWKLVPDRPGRPSSDGKGLPKSSRG